MKEKLALFPKSRDIVKNRPETKRNEAVEIIFPKENFRDGVESFEDMRFENLHPMLIWQDSVTERESYCLPLTYIVVAGSIPAL